MNGVFDQSEIIGSNKNYPATSNELGGLGAQTSELFIRFFGVAAYLLVSFTLLLAIKIIFSIKF